MGATYFYLGVFATAWEGALSSSRLIRTDRDREIVLLGLGTQKGATEF